MKISQADAESFYDEKSAGKPSTFAKNYKNPLLRILKDCMVKTNNVVACLKKHKEVIDKIINKYENVNTRKVYLQALLWFIDNYEGLRTEVNREAYLRAWEQSKLDVMETPNKEYNDLPTIDEVQNKIDDKYGKDSIQSLYISFFREVPMRLDYQNIKVYKSTTEVPEDAVKYIVYRTKKLIMKEYNKTSKKYGVAEYPLSDELITKIKNSLEQKPRPELIQFSNNNPTKAVANMLRGADMNLTLNSLRHIMSIGAITPADKVELAKKMGHSIQASRNYRAQIKDEKDLVKIDIPRRHEDAIRQLIADYLELNELD